MRYCPPSHPFIDRALASVVCRSVQLFSLRPPACMLLLCHVPRVFESVLLFGGLIECAHRPLRSWILHFSFFCVSYESKLLSCKDARLCTVLLLFAAARLSHFFDVSGIMVPLRMPECVYWVRQKLDSKNRTLSTYKTCVPCIVLYCG